MIKRNTGFAVIYQWLVKPEKEQQFLRAWQTLTDLQMKERGVRGSRLHKSENGTWIAYAQWPDRESWVAACELQAADDQLSQQILDAVEDTWPPLFLTPVAGHLTSENEVSPESPGPHVTH